MIRGALMLMLFSGAVHAAPEQQGPSPEECIAQRNAPGAVEFEYEGVRYRLAREECRVEFLSDPDRYAQLYDALLELEAEGAVLEPPAPASLVPS